MTYGGINDTVGRYIPRMGSTTPIPMVEVFASALRLGLTSFGGPAAHIGYFRHEYVERRRWLDDAEYGDLVALSQSLPGPASSQLGIAIGTRRAGPLGGIVAWLGFTAPSVVALLVFASLTSTAEVAGAGWVHGLGLAAVAVVAHAVWTMAGRLAPDGPRRAVALVAALVAVAVPTAVTQVGIIVAGGLIGRFVLAPPHGSPPVADDPTARRVPRPLAIGALVTFVALLVGMPLLRALGIGELDLVDAFYRTGALVFGGGHVVLPLLQTSVVDPGWVTQDRFLAGYGAAQAVPGPLFSFAAYLGAVSTSPPGGVAGGLVATVAIFLPSFLLVFGVLPLWDRLRAAAGARAFLAGTNAAVVGLLAAALYAPIWTTAVRVPADALLAGAGLLLLASGRVHPIVVVGLSVAVSEAIARL